MNITELLARRDAVQAAAQGLPDDFRGDVLHAAWTLDKAILATPAASPSDLEIKFALWDELIADPASILDEHAALWQQLKADWRRCGLGQ